jgi:hypothetical protein
MLQNNKWGFSQVHNHADVEGQWPDKKLMDKAIKKTDNFGVFTWRCEISNHGMANVFDIKIPITFTIENEKITYDAIITPLDVGSKFYFYPVNDCPSIVIATLPDTVELQVFGEMHRRIVRLHRTYKTIADGIMMLFGSTVRLIGDVPCG